MKKTGVTIMILSAALLFSGASVWEGAVSVSLNGELPKGGLYAATRSFPRNTVVDVTNLENGKTVRVTVAAGMDSPGLLAILSSDAAEALGIPVQSTGRVRMTMPTDSEAFSLFTGGANTGGSPPRLTAVPAPAPRPAGTSDTTTPGADAPDTSDTPPARETPEDPDGEAPVPESGKYDADPPAPGEGALVSDGPPEPLLVDMPGTPEEEPDPETRDAFAGASPQAIPVSEGPEEDAALLETPLAAESPEDEFTDLPELAEEPLGLPPEELAAEDDAEALIPGPETRPEEIAAEDAGTEGLIPEPETEEIAAEDDGTEGLIPGPETGETPEFSLVPAEARPPEASAFTLPPEAEISPIPDASLAETPAEDLGAEPPREDPGYGPGEPADSGIGIAGEEPSDGGESAEEPPGGARAGEDFSLPASPPEKGKYYLQLGSYTKAELAEAALSRIEEYYPLTVRIGGTLEKPVYRLLLGPVNLGEGGALLQRFKRGGYRDAFIRDN
jgi:hypothetical protein